MLELLSRHTADGCTYLEAIMRGILLLSAIVWIPYMHCQDIKKSSQQEGDLLKGRNNNKTIIRIPQDGGKVKGVANKWIS